LSDKPQFPIKVFFYEDNDEWILNSEDDIALNLEWFDSEDIEENTKVTDRLGRPVRLKVEALQVIKFELKLE
jgi:hypothetical protein